VRRRLLLHAIGSFVVVGLAGQAQIDPAALGQLLSMPRELGHSEIRADYDAARERTRVWINTNEDDARLWSRAGQQMDMETRVSAFVPGRGGRWPTEIDIEFASLGTLEPGAEPHALELVADGRPAVFRQTPQPTSRSGPMVFLTTRVTVGMAEFVRLASASKVEGRIWGREFVVTASNLELLRAYVARLHAVVGSA
jgi:hypothetical protein